MERKQMSIPAVLAAGPCPMGSVAGRFETEDDTESRAGYAHVAPGLRSAHLLPSHVEKSLSVERSATLQHVIDGAAELGGKDPEPFSFAVLFLQSVEKTLMLGLPFQEEHGGFGESPFEVSVSHLAPARRLSFAVGLTSAGDEPGVGKEVSDLRKPFDVLNFVKEGQGQNLSDAGNGAQQVKGRGVVGANAILQVELHLMDRLIQSLEQGQVRGHGHLDLGVVSEVFEQRVPVAVPGDSPEVGQVVLGIGVLKMSQKLGALSYEAQAPSEQISGGAHGLGIDVGHRQHATTEERRDFERVDPIVLGFTAVNGLHVVGVPEHEMDFFVGAEIGEPIPTEKTLAGDDEIVSERFDEIEKGVRSSASLSVEHLFPVGIEDAGVERSSVEIDSGVVSMLLGVKSHGGLLCEGFIGYPPVYRVGRLGRGPQI
ncbi:hypothetical protein AC249_AIPGENE5433, partial [Exaiptasia diaphana]